MEELERILCNPQEHDANQPILCPNEMYGKIRLCWNPKSDQRPSALDWRNYLCDYLEQHFKPVKSAKIVLFDSHLI